ncbi:MAG: hypothetical protein JXA33_21780 [Anaerolineae bacterium]|nr:hypothetical protein [Anaerolineae bacterium]
MSVLWQQSTHGIPKRREKANRTIALLFLSVVGVVSVLAAAYLGLVAANVRISRQVWALEYDLTEMERQNQSLRVECARLGSIPVLQELSVKMGYQPATAVDYLYVGGP